jgi:hypothetical protein
VFAHVEIGAPSTCRNDLAPPVLPGDRFGNRLVHHAKMRGDAGKREAKLM